MIDRIIDCERFRTWPNENNASLLVNMYPMLMVFIVSLFDGSCLHETRDARFHR
jgi:hypothetical protein